MEALDQPGVCWVSNDELPVWWKLCVSIMIIRVVFGKILDTNEEFSGIVLTNFISPKPIAYLLIRGWICAMVLGFLGDDLFFQVKSMPYDLMSQVIVRLDPATYPTMAEPLT